MSACGISSTVQVITSGSSEDIQFDWGQTPKYLGPSMTLVSFLRNEAPEGPSIHLISAHKSSNWLLRGTAPSSTESGAHIHFSQSSLRPMPYRLTHEVGEEV